MPVLSRKVPDSILIPTKTKDEIEAAICEGISRFEQGYMGWRLKNIHAYLIDDHILVRLQGVLSTAEQNLVKSVPAGKGWMLLKHARSQLIETGWPRLEWMVKEAAGVKVLSLHYDISTVTGEEIVLFTLAESPFPRNPKP
ncbi:MAG TPA: DUF2294 domain-containing protein [Gemmataceae bacterium]|jgi:uncharacterized protein YbcI|nr:DUF2294 domain-containing protein [Gemmataceae bacterium]